MKKPLFGAQRPQLVVDVANLAYRAYYAHQNLTTARGKPSGHVYGAVQSIISLHKLFHPIEWIYAYEGKATERFDALPQYKGQRGTRTFSPLGDVEAILQTLPGVNVKHPDWEADDVLAMVTQRPYRKGPMVLVTTDHDLWAFVGHPQVQVYNKNRIVDPIDLAGKYGLSSGRRLPLYKAVFGDTSDNIPPAAPRLHKRLLLEIIESFDCITPRDLIGALKTREPATPVQKLLDAQDNLWRNWAVTRLRINAVEGLLAKKGPKTPQQAEALLARFECHSLIPKLKELWNGQNPE